MTYRLFTVYHPGIVSRQPNVCPAIPNSITDNFSVSTNVTLSASESIDSSARWLLGREMKRRSFVGKSISSIVAKIVNVIIVNRRYLKSSIIQHRFQLHPLTSLSLFLFGPLSCHWCTYADSFWPSDALSHFDDSEIDFNVSQWIRSVSRIAWPFKPVAMDESFRERDDTDRHNRMMSLTLLHDWSDIVQWTWWR